MEKENDLLELKIGPVKDSPIIEDLPSIKLGKYTIFAGENNSGKTSLIRAIKDHGDFKKYKKMFIPANHVQPQNEEASNSKMTTEFSELLKSIIEPIFDKNELLNNIINNFNNSESKKDFIKKVNEILNGDFGVIKKSFDIKISEVDLKNDFIVKIIKAFVHDLYDTPIDEVDLENIGMGTQRLIVTALIRYYSEKEVKNEDKVLIIFEEPEIYLHPKWKEALYKALIKISNGSNTRVIITTHDPYFIELGKEQVIYKVDRTGKNNSTKINLVDKDSGVLKYDSDSEKNYLIFDVPSRTYFLELYEKLKGNYNYNKFDEIISKYLNIDQIYDKDEGYGNGKFTMITRLRMNLAHPKQSNPIIDSEDAIGKLIKFNKSLEK